MIVVEAVAVVITEEEEGAVGDMTIIEGVDLVTMMEVEVMAIAVARVVVMMVEVEGAAGVVHSMVIKEEKMVGMVKFLLPQPHLMVVVVVGTTHPLTILMVGMQIMEQM